MIRKANTNDLEGIVQINVNAWTINYKGIIDDDFLQKRTVEVVLKRWKESNWIEDNEISTFVYEENNIIKGFVSQKKDSGKYDCEIGSIYVDPLYQNKGIGKKLLQYMKTHFKSIGYKSMIIWTIKGFQNNSFYHNQGGKIQEETEYQYGSKKYPGIGFVFEL